MAGYSGTPLVKKLGIKAGGRVFVVRAPRNYRALVAPMPEGAAMARTLSGGVHIIHLFATTRKQLESGLRTSRAAMSQDAAIWVSWPKMASKVPTDIREDVIREVAFPLGLVDIKVCAIG